MVAAGVRELPMESIFPFAAVRGEPHIRVGLRPFGGVDPFQIFGELPPSSREELPCLLEWRHLVGLDLRESCSAPHRHVVGGSLEVGARGELVRWIIDATHGLDSLRSARHAPLPFDRLWFVVRRESIREWIPGAAERAELEACGRLITLSDVHLIVKATMNESAEAYRTARLAIPVSPSPSPPPL